MAPRPTEVKAVEALLHEPAEDARELAVRVIEALDELRAERPFYVAAVGSEDATWAYGAFATARQAEKALHGLASTGFVTAAVRVYPAGSLQAEEARTSASLRACSGCGHPAAAHNWPKSRIRGCVVAEVQRNGRVVRQKCDCEELI